MTKVTITIFFWGWNPLPRAFGWKFVFINWRRFQVGPFEFMIGRKVKK